MLDRRGRRGPLKLQPQIVEFIRTATGSGAWSGRPSGIYVGGRNWADSDDDDDRGRDGRRDDDVDELRDAFAALSAKISELSGSKK